MANTKIPVELSSTPGIVDNSNATAITIDSSENVGIGTTSPDVELEVSNSSLANAIRLGASSGARELTFQSNAVNGTNTIISGGDSTATPLLFSIGATASPTEAMRIDSSGNLLVGKTATGLANAGIEATSSNILRTTKANSASAEFNRTGTDGDIAIFWKDTSPVGSIGTRASLLKIGTGDVGLLFNSSSDAILPENIDGGAGRDGAIDLGVAGARFKDLYLSGGAYLGGTGAANHLDDYEEGTWTPALSGQLSASGQVYSVQEGTYTKIGRQVTCRFKIALSTEGSFSNVYIVLQGFPFTIASSPSTVHMGNLYFTSLGANFISLGLQGHEGASRAYIWGKTTASDNREYLGINDLANTTTLTGTFTYFV